MARLTADVQKMKEVRNILAEIDDDDAIKGIVAYTDFCINAIENNPFKALAERTEWIIPPRPANKPVAARPEAKSSDAKPS